MNDFLITFLASFLIWVMFGGLLVLWIIDGRIKQEQAMHAFLGSIFVYILTTMMKAFIPIPRPFVVNGVDALTLTTHFDNAFPSSHTAVAFTLAVIIFLHDKKVGALFLFCALLVGTARIFANVHYPIDILAGAAIGSLTALLVENIHAYDIIKRVSKRK